MITTLRAAPDVASSSFRNRLSFKRFINVTFSRERIEPGAICRRGAGQPANPYRAERPPANAEHEIIGGNFAAFDHRRGLPFSVLLREPREPDLAPQNGG